MAEMRDAIHVCAGDRSAEAQVDQWLEGGGFCVRRFDEVYSACVHLVTHPDHPADIVAVGAGWLSRDELAIVGYVEQTWPGAALVVYGFPDDAELIDVSPHAVVCRTRAQLRELMTRTPAEFSSARDRGGDDETWRDGVADRLATKDRNERALLTNSDEAEQATQSLLRLSARQDELNNEPPRPSSTNAAPSDSSDEIELTREELAALLEDADR